MKYIPMSVDGWTIWVRPKDGRFRLACCDCGLVHDMEFALDLDEMPAFRMRRNNRSTARVRAATLKEG